MAGNRVLLTINKEKEKATHQLFCNKQEAKLINTLKENGSVILRCNICNQVVYETEVVIENEL